LQISTFFDPDNMRLIFTSYAGVPGYNDPERWLKRIEGYTGILEALSERHTVFGIEQINFEGRYHQKNVDYIFNKQERKQVYFPFRLHSRIRELHPDVVFINGFIFPLQVVQLRLALRRGVKIIILHRSEKPFKGIKKWMQKLADKCVDGYLFTSLEFEKDWKRIISDRGKIFEVIPGSSIFRRADKQKSRAAMSVSGDPIFLWVGRLNANKDPLTVIRAFKKYLQIVPAARLYMIYQEDCLLTEVNELIHAEPNTSGSIILVGKVGHGDLESWYSSADFILSGSHYEGGGIAISEAMSCGCIPVVTNITSFSKMTGDGKCGLLYEPGNADQLFRLLIGTKDLDLEKGSAAVLDQFHNNLSFEAIAKKINKIIAVN
jgi:glycosyltransferase involved in cell wall biosynthesis